VAFWHGWLLQIRDVWQKDSNGGGDMNSSGSFALLRMTAKTYHGNGNGNGDGKGNGNGNGDGKGKGKAKAKAMATRRQRQRQRQ
jgi:hypothetical protein